MTGDNFNIETKEKLERTIRRFEKSPLSFLIRKKRLTLLIVIALFVAGIFQINTLPKELNPEIEIPFAYITTVYPGASPSNIESQITEEIESKIADLEGIKEINSSSKFGVSQIEVEFEADEDLDDSIRKLKDKVDEVKPALPEDADEPSVIEVNFNDEPILVFSLRGNNYDKSELKNFADNLKEDVKRVGNVNKVNVVGGEDKEFRVDIQPDRLNALGLSVNEINDKIAGANINIPLGSIDVGEFSYAVRVENEFKTAEELSELIVANKNGADIRLKDVAIVEENFQKRETISRISIAGDPAEDSVALFVHKRTGGDITKIADEVRTIVEEKRGLSYPEDIDVKVTTDTAKYTQESINTLLRNGLGTIGIILLLLILFIGFREALITSLAIPFSFFISFIVMASLDQSLNFITLFSLVLALGLLVDSAMVIVEGMHEKVIKYKMTGYEAAMLSVKEYSSPLLAGMLTTIAVFFPLLFVKDIFGQFLKGIPIVIIATLTAALFVALTIIPTIGSMALKPKDKNKNVFSGAIEWLVGKYDAHIGEIISKKKNRLTVLIGAWVLLILAALLPISGILKMEAFGSVDQEEFAVDLEMPEGTVLEKTDEITKEIEEKLYEIPEIENFVTSIGSNGENKSQITVNLSKKKEREITSIELSEVVREKTKNITEGWIEVRELEEGPPDGEPLEARMSGSDLVELERISEDMKRMLEEIKGAADVKTNIRYLPGDFLVAFNPDIMAEYGLSTAGVALEIRNGIAKNDDLKILREGDELKINVGYENNRISNINDLKNLTISAPTGEEIAIGTLAEVRIVPSISSINRVDQERTVTISGRNEKDFKKNEIMAEFKEKMESYSLPAGYVVSYGGANEEQSAVYADMFMKMILGAILVLFILIVQFNSFRQVGIIMFTVPLAMIGVIGGMTTLRLTLDIPAFIGVISLWGIVVNDAIILIDQINRNRKEKKMGIVQATTCAGHARMQPILLTTATTVFGLLPLSISDPGWRNMGFSIIFGLSFSTVLTLIIVPTLYVSLEIWKKRRLEKCKTCG